MVANICSLLYLFYMGVKKLLTLNLRLIHKETEDFDARPQIRMYGRQRQAAE